MEDEQKERFRTLVKENLTWTEKLIAILFYYEEMTMNEIGAVLYMPEVEVHQRYAST